MLVGPGLGLVFLRWWWCEHCRTFAASLRRETDSLRRASAKGEHCFGRFFPRADRLLTRLNAVPSEEMARSIRRSWTY